MSDKPTVFIVDDDEAAADSVAALLTSLDFQSRVFNTAEDFLGAYDGSQQGCLVLDIRMSGMSGLELYRILRDRGFEIPTIFISGHMDSDSCQQAMHSGAIACLEKPYAGKELCDLVSDAIHSNES